jgi:biopolymer transport protein ExbD
MAQASSDSSGIIAGINVTPRVDVTLVLLIIFMVTAKILAAPAVPLDLPRSAQSEEIQVVFSIILPAQGPTLVDGVPLSDDQALLTRAREALGKDRDVRAVINADGAVPHRRVIHTLGILKRVGITRVAFGAIPEEETAP